MLLCVLTVMHALSLGFTTGLDESVGEFVLTQPNMQIPARGKPIYSINEANRWQWDEPLRDYVTAIQKGEGQTGKQYTARYLGSMVGDIHRTLLYGGIFGYPGDEKTTRRRRSPSVMEMRSYYFGSVDDVMEARSRRSDVRQQNADWSDDREFEDCCACGLVV